MRKAPWLLLAAALALLACEDGPEQVFEPFEGDPQSVNEPEAQEPFIQEGSVPTEVPACNPDLLGETAFCCEEEHEGILQGMVVQPVIPDVSIGGVSLWSEEGPPLNADTLPGRPEQGKLCDPDVYSNALVWGPLNEIIVFMNDETHVVEEIYATEQYKGGMEGEFKRYGEEGLEDSQVRIQMRERIFIGDQELDQFVDQENQEDSPNAWLNHRNITDLYRFIRQNYFNEPADEHPADWDCVADGQVCNVFYTEGGSGPQDTLIYIVDSGFFIQFTPEGQVSFMGIEHVLEAPFENASLDLGEPGEGDVVGNVVPTLQSDGCNINLSEDLSFGQLVERCLGAGSTETLQRFTFDVSGQRDAAFIDFNGVELGFLHPVNNQADLLKDGQRPDDTDMLYTMTITRQLNAVVNEFQPLTIATAWKEGLEARLRAAVAPEAAEDHPFLTWELQIPGSFTETPVAISALTLEDESNWVEGVTRELITLYYSLSDAERALVDPMVVEATWLIEPFVAGVLSAFTQRHSELEDSFTVFQNTDDQKWVISESHFLQDGDAYRVVVQYSLNYNAITAITFARGLSQIDTLLGDWRKKILRDDLPYYDLSLSQRSALQNPYALDGKGFKIGAYDRQLKTIEVEFKQANSRDLIKGAVPGTPIEERGGYSRQIRGMRSEFIPATSVQMNGKESTLLFHVEADGQIGRIAQSTFKGALELCPGLEIRYGDYVKQKVEAWADEVGLNSYRQCELFFNYSPNGNIIDSAVSLSKRIEFGLYNGRATSATIWR